MFSIQPFADALVSGTVGVLGTTVLGPRDGILMVGAFAAGAALVRLRRARMESEDGGFYGRLARGLDMASGEAEVLDVVGVALAGTPRGSTTAAVLTAGGALSVGSLDAAAPCGQSPARCPVMRIGRTLAFTTSDALDVCPTVRAGPRCAGACVPVNVSGQTTGVLRVQQPVGKIVPISMLETVASLAGVRLAVLRAMATTVRAASTDPLTGALNRRGFDEAVAVAAGRPYSVAVADLDYFKGLNDCHGHEVGDRALRAFVDTLRQHLRPDDIVARFGGEEFVVLFPGCGATPAGRALERVRCALAEALPRQRIPPFTVSFGVAGALAGDAIEATLRLADEAVYAAKHAGRDRIIVAGEAQGLALVGH